MFSILATFRKSDIVSVAGANSDPLPIHLILDNIRTPENLGALLRVAAGAGCKQVGFSSLAVFPGTSLLF